MPQNITDVSTFTDPIQSVQDGDAANAANFKLAPQGLANRTRHLKNRVDAHDVKLADKYSWDNEAHTALQAINNAGAELRRVSAQCCEFNLNTDSANTTVAPGDVYVLTKETGFTGAEPTMALGSGTSSGTTVILNANCAYEVSFSISCSGATSTTGMFEIQALIDGVTYRSYSTPMVSVGSSRTGRVVGTFMVRPTATATLSLKYAVANTDTVGTGLHSNMTVKCIYEPPTSTLVTPSFPVP
jgi:hypothetical protein